MGDQTNYLWGGRFIDGPASIMREINNSIGYDHVLYHHDITASLSHVKMLGKQGILQNWEVDKIVQGLHKVYDDIKENKAQFREELEDIHSNIEFLLSQEIGDLAGKMHTARSRNDQVVTDFKMWIRESIKEIDKYVLDLMKVFVNLAESNIDCIIPGFTHLQIAQPVLFAHHVLAYVEMLKRDRHRLQDCYNRMNECPLGCAALAGTSFDIDREFTAKELGFDMPTQNSIDSISDRDFVVEFLSSLSLCMMHLSRWAEELILWCSDGFKLIELEDKFTSGSSIMPQKKNPDAAELVRAKCSVVHASMSAVLNIMKGLPLTYNKDMQEDKRLVFSTVQEVILCLKVMSGMSAGIKVNKETSLLFARKGYSTATDLADWLVKSLNIPFRKSHHITGAIVKIAESIGISDLSLLTLEQMQQVEPLINKDVFSVLSVENSVASRTSYGGTSTVNVKKSIQTAKQYLNKRKT